MSENAAAPAAPIAETSTVIERNGSETLGSLTSEQRSQWRLTGQIPDTAPPSEPAKAEEASATPAQEPATEPVKPAEAPKQEAGVSKRQAYINDQVRLRTEAQLRAEKAEAELAALRAGQAPQQPKAQQFAENDPKPSVDKFESYEDFAEALAEWKYRGLRREELAADAAARQVRQQSESRVTHEQRIAGWHDKLNEHIAANPGYTEKVGEFLGGIDSNSTLAAILADSPVGPQLAEHFVDHPQDLARLDKLPLPHALREIGRIEARYEKSATPAATAPAPAPAATLAPPKTVSSAPAPPATVATHTETGDAVTGALIAGDFARYRNAQNAKEIAASKR